MRLFQNLLLRTLAIIVSIWPALYNGFPLVTPDTGTYISSGITMSLPIDRPWGYGIFILASSLNISLWGVVLFQGIIFTWLISLLCKQIWGPRFPFIYKVLIITFLSFCTSVAWFNAQLMADVFTGMLLVCIVIIYLKSINNEHPWWLYLLTFFFTLTHNSHILIVFILAFILLIYHHFFHKNNNFKKASKILISLCILSFLSVGTMNLVKFKDFSMSPGSHIFLLSRMVEQGLVDNYLEKNCENNDLKLCQFKDQIGDRQWVFMWSEHLPHNQENGWIASQHEYKKIITSILTTPQSLGLLIIKNIEGTFRQLTQIYVGDGLSPLKKDSPPYNAIENHFSHQLKEYRSSLQHRNELPLQFINQFSIIFSLAICFFALYKSQSTRNKILYSINWNIAFILVILFLILNAFITSTLSTVIGRLQVRTFWVLPFISLLYLIDIYKSTITSINPKVKPFL